MITRDDYFMGRDRAYPQHLTDQIEKNAAEWRGRINQLLAWAAMDNVRPAIDRRTSTHMASGWRPPEINDATANAATGSSHLSGEGGDLRDTPNQDLARWCLKNFDALDELGLYMEDPRWTGTEGGDYWVHLQTRRPKSGNRVYVPSTKPPRLAMLPEYKAAMGLA